MIQKIIKRHHEKAETIYSDNIEYHSGLVVWYTTSSGNPAILRRQNSKWGFAYLHEFLTSPTQHNFNLKFEANTIKDSINRALDANREICATNDISEFMTKVLACQ